VLDFQLQVCGPKWHIKISSRAASVFNSKKKQRDQEEAAAPTKPSRHPPGPRPRATSTSRGSRCTRRSRASPRATGRCSPSGSARVTPWCCPPRSTPGVLPNRPRFPSLLLISYDGTTHSRRAATARTGATSAASPRFSSCPRTASAAACPPPVISGEVRTMVRRMYRAAAATPRSGAGTGRWNSGTEAQAVRGLP
jgi:hypothetical protein